MIVVGGRIIDTDRCVEDDESGIHEHHCVHDWRYTWGNVDKQGSG